MCLAMVLEDELLMATQFWAEDLTVPKTREDLGDLVGKITIKLPQKLLLLDRSIRQASCTGRKTIKTINLEVKSVQWPLWNRREIGHDEAMIVTPGQTHQKMLMDRVFPRVDHTPLFSLFCPPDQQLRGDGVQRWQGVNIYVSWRLEGLSGTDKNMAGLRCKWILGDEMAYGNAVCHGSRIQTALPFARIIYSGVPNFIDSPFRRITSEPYSEGWSIHRGSTYDFNPLYESARAKKVLINSYDGVEDPLYVTQVLGIWDDNIGSSAWPSGCFDWHNRAYAIIEPVAADVKAKNWAKVLADLKPVYKHYIMGWDYGFAPDPAVMMLFGSNDQKTWLAAARIRFREVMQPEQVDLVLAIHKVLKQRILIVSSDSRTAVQSLEKRRGHTIKCVWSEPQGATVRKTLEGDPMLNEEGKEVKVRNREFYSEIQRDSMSYGLLKAPYHFYMKLCQDDHDLSDEMAGTTSYRTRAGYLVYAAREKTPGSKSDEDHNTDALRFGAHAAYYLWLKGVEPGDNVPLDQMGLLGKAVMPGQDVKKSMEDLRDRLYPAPEVRTIRQRDRFG